MTPEGLWVWCWQWQKCDGGDAAQIAARVKAAGAQGVIVKAADGNHWFDQGQPVSAIIAACHAAGIGCATWQYCYGADPAGEARMAVETIAAGPDFHVFDVEQEFEDQPDPAAAATTLLSVVAAGVPKGYPLAYAPLPIADLHTKLPYRQFTDAGCAMLPQTYWTGLQWSEAATVARTLADMRTYGLLTQPLYPAYEDAQGAQSAASDITSFAADLAAAGLRGASVWEYGQMDAGAWTRAATLAAALNGAQPTPDPTPPSTLLQQLADARATIVAWELWHAAAEKAFIAIAAQADPFAQQGGT
jgi:hypothetical protein